jgi:hypothetical protein
MVGAASLEFASGYPVTSRLAKVVAATVAASMRNTVTVRSALEALTSVVPPATALDVRSTPSGTRVQLGVEPLQIARIVGCSMATAKIRVHRARRRLRETPDAACSFETDERGVLVCAPNPPSARPTGTR